MTDISKRGLTSYIEATLLPSLPPHVSSAAKSMARATCGPQILSLLATVACHPILKVGEGRATRTEQKAGVLHT